jgi:hypothetical protein
VADPLFVLRSWSVSTITQRYASCSTCTGRPRRSGCSAAPLVLAEIASVGTKRQVSGCSVRDRELALLGHHLKQIKTWLLDDRLRPRILDLDVRMALSRVEMSIDDLPSLTDANA